MKMLKIDIDYLAKTYGMPLLDEATVVREGDRFLLVLVSLDSEPKKRRGTLKVEVDDG